MYDFFLTALSFPTVLFTGVLGFVLLYWLVVIAGALDLEFIDSALGLDSMEAAVDGALESVEGLGDGALDAAADGLDGLDAADAAADGVDGLDAESAAETGDADTADGAREGALSGFLNAMGVRGVPITIVASFVLLWAWALSYAGTKLLGPAAASAIVGLFLAAASLGGALVLGAVSARPFRKLFVTTEAPRRASLVGKMCVVTSGRVDERTGQAEIEDGGAGFVAEVRCPQSNGLKRGSKALVYRYDKSEGVFFIGPVDDALSEASELIKEPR